jgi:hypothetical protein
MRTALRPRSGSLPASRPLSQLDAAAAYLRLEPDELVAYLDHGGSLAGLARNLGRSADGVVDVVLASARAQLDPKLRETARERVLADLRRRLLTGAWHPTVNRARLAA